MKGSEVDVIVQYGMRSTKRSTAVLIAKCLLGQSSLATELVGKTIDIE